MIRKMAWVDYGTYHGPVEGFATQIGDGTNVWDFASVQAGARIGANCTIGMYAHIGKNVVVGNGCKIQNGAQLFEGVTLEDDVFVGPHAVFTNVLTPRAFKKASEYKPTLVRRGVSIGANATIVCGVTIGEYAQIGAGTVVTRDVEPYTRMIGVPARKSCYICRCGNPVPRWHDAKFECTSCRTSYRFSQGLSNLIVEELADGEGP